MFYRVVKNPISLFRSKTSILKPNVSTVYSNITQKNVENNYFLTKRFNSFQASSVPDAFNVDTSKVLICDVLNTYLRDITSEKNEVLFEPFKHSYLIPHTNIMPEFFDSMNYWINLSEEDLNTVKEIIYMLQEGLIILDDATDGSKLRRGFPTTHTIFGSDRCVYTCTSLILSAIKKLHVDNRQKAVENIYKNLLTYFSSLAQETDFRNSGICPTKKEYLKLSMTKMASLYDLCINVMQGFKKCDKDFSTFSAILGLYIQIMNDTINCSLNKSINDKNFAEDISNGMYNYPIVLAVEKGTLESNILRNVMRQKTDSLELRKYCVDLMEKLGVLDESRETEALLFRLLLDEIVILGGNPQLEKVLKKIYNWKIDELYPNHPDYKKVSNK